MAACPCSPVVGGGVIFIVLNHIFVFLGLSISLSLGNKQTSLSEPKLKRKPEKHYQARSRGLGPNLRITSEL